MPTTPTRTRVEAPLSGRSTSSRARGDRPGEVPPEERARLRRTFGQALWSARVQAGVTQAELTRRAGLGPRTVEKLERGVCRPSDTMCRRLAAALLPGRDEVAVAVLVLDLEAAAGESLRRWHRRKPPRQRVQRVFAEAAHARDERERRAARKRIEEDTVLAEWMAALDESVEDARSGRVPDSADLWEGQRRPSVRRYA